MKPWWELYPGRLEYEVEKLEAVGVVVILNREVQDNDNLLQLKLSIPASITETLAIDASVTFPDYYPYIPPKVFLPDVDLPHHLNPFTKEICLLGVPGEDWAPSDTLARLLTEQMPEALRAGADDPKGGNWNEVRQAEPYGAYYNNYLRTCRWNLEASYTCSWWLCRFQVRRASSSPGRSGQDTRRGVHGSNGQPGTISRATSGIARSIRGARPRRTLDAS